ncbi:hypothetical protein O181_081500 [Austropuccinia psidii MF-1]|uniref:Uncharacterized protein n=1 Tax=Austropuccinia psidii MF-1 TaxID=1389203 RepID=A0A9Q3FJ47_9BASI|nr:hypothetical protein [Austropuccinia psidii MF-1]
MHHHHNLKNEIDPTIVVDSRNNINYNTQNLSSSNHSNSNLNSNSNSNFNQPKKIANPTPLGLASFSGTTFVLSLFNAHIRDVHVENLIVSLAFGYGGLVQLLAGMWEFACGNTFGATAFSAYGGFWISFGLILYPNSGIAAAYANSQEELHIALGFFLFSWFIFTTIMLIAALRSSVALIALFFFLDVTFLLLGIGQFYHETQTIVKAGGVFGLITSFIGWYITAASLFEAGNHPIRLPVFDLSSNNRV